MVEAKHVVTFKPGKVMQDVVANANAIPKVDTPAPDNPTINPVQD